MDKKLFFATAMEVLRECGLNDQAAAAIANGTIALETNKTKEAIHDNED